MLETDIELRNRILHHNPLSYVWCTSLLTATGHQLDAIAEAFDLVRKKTCTEQETDIK